MERMKVTVHCTTRRTITPTQDQGHSMSQHETEKQVFSTKVTSCMIADQLRLRMPWYLRSNKMWIMCQIINCLNWESSLLLFIMNSNVSSTCLTCSHNWWILLITKEDPWITLNPCIRRLSSLKLSKIN